MTGAKAGTRDDEERVQQLTVAAAALLPVLWQAATLLHLGFRLGITCSQSARAASAHRALLLASTFDCFVICEQSMGA